jgi:hypothetical protein
MLTDDHRHMNVEIGTEDVQFPEKEYINEIFVAGLIVLIMVEPVVVNISTLVRVSDVVHECLFHLVIPG